MDPNANLTDLKDEIQRLRDNVDALITALGSPFNRLTDVHAIADELHAILHDEFPEVR